jgi:uncharacterized phiE125 gp8 family phage protein
MYGLTLVTPPALEPVTLAEAKKWLKVDVSDDDDLISELITAARQAIEEEIGRQLITATWRLSPDGLYAGPIYLPRPPLQSVTSVQYYDAQGTLQTLATGDYQVNKDGLLGRLTPAVDAFWPCFQLNRSGAVQVTYVAGYGGTGVSVPGPIKTAIKLRVQVMYIRGEKIDPLVQETIDSLLSPYWAKSYQ